MCGSVVARIISINHDVEQAKNASSALGVRQGSPHGEMMNSEGLMTGMNVHQQ